VVKSWLSLGVLQEKPKLSASLYAAGQKSLVESFCRLGGDIIQPGKQVVMEAADYGVAVACSNSYLTILMAVSITQQKTVETLVVPFGLQPLYATPVALVSGRL